jgi:hypothetical protein
MRLVCYTGSALSLYRSSEPTATVGHIQMQLNGQYFDLRVGDSVTDLTVELPVQAAGLKKSLLSTVSATGHGC